MTHYAKNNLFIGKYQLPSGGWLRLPDDAHFVVRHLLRQQDDGTYWGLGDGPISLILEDGNFWPVMVSLTDKEAASLVKDLLAALARRKVSPNAEAEKDVS